MKRLKKNHIRLLVSLVICAPLFIIAIPYYLSVPAIFVYALIVSVITKQSYGKSLEALLAGTLISAVAGLICYYLVAYNVAQSARTGMWPVNIVVGIAFIVLNYKFVKAKFARPKQPSNRFIFS